MGSKDDSQIGHGRGWSKLYWCKIKLLAGDLHEKIGLVTVCDLCTQLIMKNLRTGIWEYSKGAATGVFQTMVTNGYIGIIATLGFALSMLMQMKNRRMKLCNH